MKFCSAYYSDIGKKETNQDSLLLMQRRQPQGDEIVFAVICDGVGGARPRVAPRAARRASGPPWRPGRRFPPRASSQAFRPASSRAAYVSLGAFHQLSVYDPFAAAVDADFDRYELHVTVLPIRLHAHRRFASAVPLDVRACGPYA